MAHIDPDEIALYALGERVRPEVEQHLADCPECRDEADALARAVLIGRGTIEADRLIAPDPKVWDAVRAELGIADAVGAADPARAVAASNAAVPAAASGDEVGARRRRRGIRTGVALLVAAVVLVGAVVVIPRIIAAPTPLAMTQLTALPGWKGASGQAELVELPNGSRQLDVTLVAPAVQGGYREVWLLDRSGDGEVVGLGIIDGSSISLDVPGDIDLTKFDVVDVSAEPADGDPTHSKNSIVRGKLRFGAGSAALH